MAQINAKIDDELLNEFRSVIFHKMGLKKGDFKKALEDAMLEYIDKYSTSESGKRLAKKVRQ